MVCRDSAATCKERPNPLRPDSPGRPERRPRNAPAAADHTEYYSAALVRWPTVIVTANPTTDPASEGDRPQPAPPPKADRQRYLHSRRPPVGRHQAAGNTKG